jgi:aminoglycoside phosphotransferase (APT) family kinase protein
MNPDAKATEKDIRTICERHDISYDSHERITAGFSHEVHRLNDDLVLKLFNSYDNEDERRFNTEVAVLGSTLDFKKPRLVASAKKDELIDRDHIIMSYIPGRSLGSHWHEATETQRERLIADISQTLKTINRINPAKITAGTVKPWDASLGDRAQKITSKLLTKGTIDNNTAEKINRVVDKLLPIVSDSPLYPVYWDVHLDNFIVDDDFKLQAIIDLENVEPTSLDYPLFVVEKMVNDPIKFLREEDEKYADKKDYEHLREYYQKYYPEMFNFPHLDNRVKLYKLLDILHLLQDWPDDEQLYEQLDELTDE